MEDKLPVVDYKHDFFDMDTDKSKLTDLVDKYIVLEIKENNKISVMVAKFLKLSGESIFVRLFDDGSKETHEEWGMDVLKQYEEEVLIENIRGIELNTKYNNFLFDDSWINKICEITNKNGSKITVLINGFDGVNVWFINKYSMDGKIFVSENNYLFNFITDVKVVNL